MLPIRFDQVWLGVRWRTFALAAVLAVAITAQVAAESQAVCHRLMQNFNWVDGTILKGCQPGDVLIAQMNNVAPAAIVGRYCDLRFSIFSDKRSDTDHTVVCRLRETAPVMRPNPQ